MRQGKALTDESRLPWLLSIHHYLKSLRQSDQNGVVACSALKQKYRHLLNSGLIYELGDGKIRKTEPLVDLGVLFVLLNCSMDLIEMRLHKHKIEFTNPQLGARLGQSQNQLEDQEQKRAQL